MILVSGIHPATITQVYLERIKVISMQTSAPLAALSHHVLQRPHRVARARHLYKVMMSAHLTALSLVRVLNLAQVYPQVLSQVAPRSLVVNQVAVL